MVSPLYEINYFVTAPLSRQKVVWGPEALVLVFSSTGGGADPGTTLPVHERQSPRPLSTDRSTDGSGFLHPLQERTGVSGRVSTPVDGTHSGASTPSFS